MRFLVAGAAAGAEEPLVSAFPPLPDFFFFLAEFGFIFLLHSRFSASSFLSLCHSPANFSRIKPASSQALCACHEALLGRPSGPLETAFRARRAFDPAGPSRGKGLSHRVFGRNGDMPPS